MNNNSPQPLATFPLPAMVSLTTQSSNKIEQNFILFLLKKSEEIAVSDLTFVSQSTTGTLVLIFTLDEIYLKQN